MSRTGNQPRECESQTFELRLATFPHVAAHLEEVKSAIRHRAYELFEALGGQEGHALDHWLKAEGELLKPASYEMEEFPDRLEV